MERCNSAYDHIEKIRRETFYIGRDEKNPLAAMVHRTVGYLSEELYSKDVHFLMELIQNAEDNEYPSGVAPSLEFMITSKDITETGAASTLIVFNNEKGFSKANIESICGAGISTKKGNRHRGYIGEKGIGFKSVFLISSQPHIFSNGYQIRFNEKPCEECSIGYIVPEWVTDGSMLSKVKELYGASKPLPTTTLILPLKSDKIVAVKGQLSKMHPEILLFLSKIRHLSVKENNDNPALNTVSQVSISSETEAQTQKNINAKSFTCHLASLENGEDEEDSSSYFMWVQKFPVKPECRVEKRMEVDEWSITLAFPWNQRLNRGQKMPGIYAFLPTEMETGFPFIIQADFLLNSSRESIQFDSVWNKGILECVPISFLEAFKSLVKSVESTPSFNIPSMFRFLPINSSSKFEAIRQSIKEKIAIENIVPCEQNFFCKPCDVFRLLPDFWNILDKARKVGVKLDSLSTHEAYILSSSFDKGEYSKVLTFMGVEFVDKQWYGKCIESSNLVKEVSDEIYLDLLHFLAGHWYNFFDGTNVIHIPIIKYVDPNCDISWLSVYKANQQSCNLCIASDEDSTSWLINWNREFRLTNLIFMPLRTQAALKSHKKKSEIITWLKDYVKMEVLSVYNYAQRVLKEMGRDRRLVVAFAHFIYHSSSKKHLVEWQVKESCTSMPLIDNYGQVNLLWSKVLVPAKGSEWVGLMGTNPWRSEGYVELGAEYISSGCFAGNNTPENQLLTFLMSYIGASDVPKICPPNASFPTVYSPLSKSNTILLLEWIRKLRYRGIQIPYRFLECIKNGSWLKTSVGYKPPSSSFLSSSDWGSLLQAECVLVDIPTINQGFYDYKLGNYKDELRLIGVRSEFGEASSYIGEHLMAKAASHNLTRANVISILKLIRVLREKQLSPKDFISSIKDKNWLKTTHGYRSPAGSVLKNSEWTTAAEISNLPFIDVNFYGNEIVNYSTELSLLGVLIHFDNNYHILVDHFKFTSPISADAAILLLECVSKVQCSANLISKLKGLRWVKTHLGYKTPIESFLVDSEWECLLKVVNEVPLIDQGFYCGKLGSYKEALNKVGILVNFEDASKAIVNQFKLLLSSNSLKKENIIALLSCYRRLKKMHCTFPVNLTNMMYSEKWLRTSNGLKSPSESILYDQHWEDISSVASLPFIDDGDDGYGKEIHEYKDELKALGAIVEFKDGARFVINGLKIPKDPLLVKPSSLIALLKCIKFFLKAKNMDDFPDKFRRNINQKWIKTYMGYMHPSECILFYSEFECYLQRDDGPFINEEFYGSELTAHKKELMGIGVVVSCGTKACSLIASHLKTHNDSAAITRIYTFLLKLKWEPVDACSDWIWIPNGDDGKWVGPDECVIRDKDNLFGYQLHVLDKLYDRSLLPFFSMVLKVKNDPSVGDYCKLWRIWESSNVQQLTVAECSMFWNFIAKNWKSKAEKLTETVTMLPVQKGTAISLSKKQDVFIPDDLLLKDLFDSASEESVFIWYPSTVSRTTMNSIYSSIGVRTISQFTKKESFSLSKSSNFREVDSKEAVIKIGLIKIILAFLANPALNISVEDRHETVKTLVYSTIFETKEPIKMSYSLTLSSGKTLKVDASKMVRWEKDESSLFVQEIDGSSAVKIKIEFATYFSEAVSNGLLYEKDDQVDALMEMIKVGCLLDFDDDGVEFLLKSKNLQLFEEDDKLLVSAVSLLKA